MILVPVFILGSQTFDWFQTETWVPLPTESVAIWLGISLSWVNEPEQWKGLAQVVRWVLDLPLSLTSFFTGLLLILFFQPDET
jgi:ABC-type sulfate transport system permease subunit